MCLHPQQGSKSCCIQHLVLDHTLNSPRGFFTPHSLKDYGPMVIETPNSLSTHLEICVQSQRPVTFMRITAPFSTLLPSRPLCSSSDLIMKLLSFFRALSQNDSFICRLCNIYEFITLWCIFCSSDEGIWGTFSPFSKMEICGKNKDVNYTVPIISPELRV